jgi:hypothetical protein
VTTRRLNYTGCIRIPRRLVSIDVADRDDRPPRFSVGWDLSEYSFPPNAVVVAEAQAHWTVMRFPLGTVGEPIAADTIDLSEFDTADGLLFRLKVIGIGAQAGLILGEADGIRPAVAQSKIEGQSFLAVLPADLGDVTWRLSLDGAEPLLLINQRLGDWRSFTRRAEVRALVIPEIYRQLLQEVIANPPDADSTNSWQFALLETVSAGAGPKPSADSPEAVDMWVDAAVRNFAHKHRLFRGLAAWSSGEA